MSNTLKEHLAKEVLTIATCWKLKLTDETVMGFTDHDKDLNIDSVFYKSSSGFTKSSVILNSNLKSDNLEIHGVINSDEITEEDVLTGRYDFANIDIFLVNYQNPNQERMSLRSGTFSKVTLNEGRFIVEINSLLDKLDQSLVVFLYSPTCRAQFCDDKCKIDQSKFSEISTVTRVIDERRFEDINLINKKDGYYKHGVVKFNTLKER